MVNTFKYLGVTLDNKLNWYAHVKSICSKMSQANGAFLKLRKLMSLKTRISLYNGLAGSHLNYGILVWGSASSYVLKKSKLLKTKF